MNLNGKSDDHVVNLLIKYGMPVTKENYISLAYPDGMPEDHELGANLPIFNDRKDTLSQLIK